MKWIKIAGWLLLAVVILMFASGFAYFLPSTEMVHVTGTEVKRMHDKPGETPSDVRFIMTESAQTGEVLVFRNEDTRWGWPPYLKFDSGDLAGEAAKMAKKEPMPTVLIRYYGMRSTLFDLFPNAVSLKEVQPTYVHLPLFNIIFLVFLLVAMVFVVFKIRRLGKRYGKWRASKKSSAPPPGPEAADEQA